MKGAPPNKSGSQLRHVRRRLPASLHEIDNLCTELRTSVLRGLLQHDRFAVELLVREALMNAVLYGAASDPRMYVWCEVERSRNAITVRVSDPGKGFDWRKYLNVVPASVAESGRGIQILSRYATALRFNDEGNSVEAIRTFDRDEEHGEF
jgi:anti-sigma regulatory factor (Ser/Thr protein kinase)